MTIRLYEKDIKLILDCTATLPIVGRLHKVPLIGRFFNYADILEFRSKLQKASDACETFEVDDEDIPMLLLVIKSGLGGSSTVDSVFNDTSSVSAILRKLLYRVRESYPQYFETES
jgi:hypothetical protein